VGFKCNAIDTPVASNRDFDKSSQTDSLRRTRLSLAHVTGERAAPPMHEVDKMPVVFGSEAADSVKAICSAPGLHLKDIHGFDG
jgi:hypothetical protein